MTRHPAPTLCALLVALMAASSVAAQTAAPPAGCEDAVHRQFDFWAGQWAVTGAANGNVAGSNTIEIILGGCVLQENWSGAGGTDGKSFNYFDDGQWRQLWLDSSGNALELAGNLEEGSMVLRGESPARDGGTAQHEIRYEPREDGTVRQTWRASRDGGKNWNVLFDGIYTRVGD